MTKKGKMSPEEAWKFSVRMLKARVAARNRRFDRYAEIFGPSWSERSRWLVVETPDGYLKLHEVFTDEQRDQIEAARRKTFDAIMQVEEE